MTPDYKRLEYGSWPVLRLPCPLHAAQYKDFRKGVQCISRVVRTVTNNSFCEVLCVVYLVL